MIALHRLCILSIYALSAAVIDPAFALPPVRSHICLAFFRQLGMTAKATPSDRTYLLHSLGAFRRHRLFGPNAAPSVADGLITSNSYTRGFASAAAASRMAGIENFMNTADGSGRFMQTATIVGRENIETFLSEFRSQLEFAGTSFQNQAIKDFKVMTGINGFLLSQVHWSALANGDPQAAAGALGIGLWQLLTKQDFVLTRPLYWDYSIMGQIDKVAKEMDSKNGWALLSKNFSINKGVVTMLRNSTDPEWFENATIRQSYSEALPVRDRILAPLHPNGKNATEKSWVGLDMIVENSAAGEPELHVILRGTEDRPPFPRGAPTNKKNETSSSTPQWNPGLAPVPAPVPIRVPGR